MSMADTQSGASKFAGTQRKLKDDIDQVKTDLGQVRDDLSTAGRDALAAARTGVAQAKERAGEVYGTARDRFSTVAEAARERGTHGAEELSAKITERPLTSVAIAFGIGMVIGLISRR